MAVSSSFPGLFPWRLIARKAGLLFRFWQERPEAPVWRDKCRIPRHKIDKRSSAGLSKAILHWYIPLAPKGIRSGMPSQEASGRDQSAPQALSVRFGTGFWEGAQRLNAGWSSPVARQAHNLKVIGSNPIPATKQRKSP
jgi:hypothetical protein